MKRAVMTTIAVLLSTAAGLAQTLGIQGVVEALRAQGYTKVEVQRQGGQIKVEALRDGSQRELIYDAGSGKVLSDEMRGGDRSDAPPGVATTPARGHTAATTAATTATTTAATTTAVTTAAATTAAVTTARHDSSSGDNSSSHDSSGTTATATTAAVTTAAATRAAATTAATTTAATIAATTSPERRDFVVRFRACRTLEGAARYPSSPDGSRQGGTGLRDRLSAGGADGMVTIPDATMRVAEGLGKRGQEGGVKADPEGPTGPAASIVHLACGGDWRRSKATWRVTRWRRVSTRPWSASLV